MLWKVIWAIVFVLLLAGFALAEPPRYVCKPAASRTYAAPVQRAYVPQPGPRGREVRVADAVFFVFDRQVKDQFIFSGPPLKIAPGLTLGVAVSGAELRSAPPAEAPARAQGDRLDRAALVEDAYASGTVLGYEDEEANTSSAAASAVPSSALAADLTRSCAECHTAGKIKGEFTLFAASGSLDRTVNWQKVAAVVTPAGPNKPPRMPPGNKTRLAQSSIREIGNLAQRSKR